jgi:hypothetical protein
MCFLYCSCSLLYTFIRCGGDFAFALLHAMPLLSIYCWFVDVYSVCWYICIRLLIWVWALLLYVWFYLRWYTFDFCWVRWADVVRAVVRLDVLLISYLRGSCLPAGSWITMFYRLEFVLPCITCLFSILEWLYIVICYLTDCCCVVLVVRKFVDSLYILFWPTHLLLLPGDCSGIRRSDYVPLCAVPVGLGHVGGIDMEVFVWSHGIYLICWRLHLLILGRSMVGIYFICCCCFLEVMSFCLFII